MNTLTPKGILLGIALLLLAIGSSVLIFKLRSEQPTTPQATIKTAE